MENKAERGIVRLLGGALKAAVKGLGRYRVWRLFHALRNSDADLARDALEYVLRSEYPEWSLSEGFLRYYVKDMEINRGALLPERPADDSVAAALDEIPSETSAAERRFLYHFFSFIWPGVGNVVEVGPFLGGTTRAIALGMLRNPRLSPDAKLHTFDRFQNYYEPAELLKFLQPMFEKGALKECDRAAIGASSSFRDVFDRIHAGTPYGPLVVPLSRPLPESREEANRVGAWFSLSPDFECDAFFVDGCKSWYATKHFMRECCARARPGSYFIFQDYLQYTCFWIPAFLGAFAEFFSLVAFVDNTYAFQLAKPLSSGDVDRIFPDAPETLGKAAMVHLFTRVRNEAERRCDTRAWVLHGIQLAGALAYMGETTAARELLDLLKKGPRASGYEQVLGEASVSPTYRPNGTGWTPVRL